MLIVTLPLRRPFPYIVPIAKEVKSGCASVNFCSTAVANLPWIEV